MGNAGCLVRIVYFSHGYTVHDRRILQALVDQEHQVFHLRLASDGDVGAIGPMPEAVQQLEWHSRGWPLSAPVLAYRLRRILNRIQPDLVHAGPVQQGALLSAIIGFRPLVTMSWGSDLLVDASAGPGRWTASFTLARSTVLLCDCETVRQRAIGLGMPGDRIVVFPWGVDLDHFSPEQDRSLRADLGWQDAFVLVSTRAWEPRLGVDVLVDGFVRAAKIQPRCRLLLLNHGSLEHAIRQQLGNAHLMDRVHFAGTVTQLELPKYYRAADCYVSASHSDGSSISLLEAMACGLPAIVSDIPGNLEWVRDQLNGWDFADGEPESLAEVIGMASASHELRTEMGKRSRAIAEQRADWQVNSRRMLEAYELAVRLGDQQ